MVDIECYPNIQCLHKMIFRSCQRLVYQKKTNIDRKLLRMQVECNHSSWMCKNTDILIPQILQMDSDHTILEVWIHSDFASFLKPFYRNGSWLSWANWSGTWLLSLPMTLLNTLWGNFHCLRISWTWSVNMCRLSSPFVQQVVYSM